MLPQSIRHMGWPLDTCYAIIYKSILNAYIDVCICNELGYFNVYLNYTNLIMNLSLSTIGIVYNHCTMIILFNHSEYIHVHGFKLKKEKQFKQCSS